MFDIIAIGHLCVDSIMLPNRPAPYTILGGSVTYFSLAAKRLGANVSIISKVGKDFPNAYLWWLSQEGIDISRVIKTLDAKTTRFELKYSDDLANRSLRLTNKAAPITLEDLPKSIDAKAAHLAPIANEIQYEVAEKLKEHVEFLSLDPQGLIRVFDENGNVTANPLADKRILENLTVFKSSMDEIKAITGKNDLEDAVKEVHNSSVETVIVTLGAEGAVLSVDGALYKVRAYASKRVVDPTGAGDAFMGGFLAEYVQGGDSLWCVCVGCAVASTVVEGLGPTFFGDRNEIYQRARILYEKGN